MNFMVLFIQLKPSINNFQIEEIEKQLGFDFPESYKNHLIKFNGGRCTPNIYNFLENGKKTESCVDWFLAIHDGPYNNLKKYISMYKTEHKRMPNHIFPIAHDPGGNLICISCGKLDYEHVFFWDHENEVDYSTQDDQDYGNLYLIARNFNLF